MSRFQKILNALKKGTEPLPINPEDESTYWEYEPRNMLADVVNPALKTAGLHALQIPKLSVADRKRHLEETFDPQNLALNMGVGRIANRNLFEEMARKFGGKKLDVPPLNEGLSKRIADAFDQMKHDPNNPEVKAAYDALIDETSKQYDDLVKQGVKVKKIKGENPYKNSKDMTEQVKKKNEIEYFPTDEGFGSGSITENPMLRKTGRVNADGEEMLANDLFRVVHDVYGHVKPHSTFGKVGEEIAYQNHKQMFSPLAQKALATETRGQNSFVNFGPNAAYNRANPANTVYAEQKVGLLPDWAINENAAKTVNEINPSLVTGPSDALRKLILRKISEEE